MTEKDVLSLTGGILTLTGMGVVLVGFATKHTSRSWFRWFRPGTWIAIFFWKLAQYATAFARGVDAFVVEYRQSKKDLEEETIRCAE